jgi:hypothetical protein
MTTPLPAGRQSPNRASWLTLAAAVLLGVYNLGLLVWPLLPPGDGWLYAAPAETGGLRLVTQAYAGGEAPTPLRVGDQILTIEGQAAEALLSGAAGAQRPERWAAGSTVRYTVLRGSQTLALDVTLIHFEPRAIAAHAVAGGPIDLVFAVILLAMPVIGGIVFWRRPREPAARVLLVFSIAITTGLPEIPSTAGGLFEPVTRWGDYLPHPWITLLLPNIVMLLLVFPMVKRPMRTHPWLTIFLVYGSAQVLIWMALLFLARWPVALENTVSGITYAALLANFILVLASVVHTFITVHNPVARAQMRWMVLALVVGFMGSVLAWVIFDTFWPEYSASLLVVNGLLILLTPLGLAVAILRYRLFDIDIIIRRTLLYAVLTVLLALAYFGSVLVLQAVLAALAVGRQSELVTVLSTLTIAALFVPLRRRVQAVIDRRLYRPKYDSAQTLAQFAASARDETDLGRLSERLVDIAEQTMQPASVSLWLRTRR